MQKYGTSFTLPVKCLYDCSMCHNYYCVSCSSCGQIVHTLYCLKWLMLVVLSLIVIGSSSISWCVIMQLNTICTDGCLCCRLTVPINSVAFNTIITTSAKRYCDPSCLLVGSLAGWLMGLLTFFGVEYLENGWRYRLDSNGPLLGNGTSDVHVIDDVMWPSKVKIVTPLCLGPIVL